MKFVIHGRRYGLIGLSTLSLSILSFAFLLPLSLEATSFLDSEDQVTLNTRSSAKVFRGEVIALTPVSENGVQYTQVAVSVLETYKRGHATNPTEIVKVPGQVIAQDRGLRIVGTPEFKLQAEYIFFVDATQYLVDWTTYQISRDGSGNRYVVSQTEGSQLRRSTSTGAIHRSSDSVGVDELDQVVSEIVSAEMH